MELFFDVETSGFVNNKLSINDPKQAWIMQLGFILSDEDKIYTEFCTLINSNNRHCHPGAQKVHGISTEDCDKVGMSEKTIFDVIANSFFNANLLVAHNYAFDIRLMKHYIERNDCQAEAAILAAIPHFCTMLESTNLCRFPGRYGNYKWPKLTELYRYLFDKDFEDIHNALADARATRQCYYRLKELNAI